MRNNKPLSSKKPATTKNSASPGQVRIIAGKYKGRKLPVLDVIGLRPTTDRVKETVFNWLMQDCHDATVLDCFAGAGSLGFEAASRYARHVTMLELDKSAAQMLTRNAALLKDCEITIQHTDSLLWLNQPATRQFELVFIDPPFRQGLVSQACELLIANGWLADNALVYVEQESEHIAALPTTLRLYKDKTAGQVCYRLYQYHPSSAECE